MSALQTTTTAGGSGFHASLAPFVAHASGPKRLLNMQTSPCGSYVLFNYTSRCNCSDKYWDDLLIQCRGVVFEIETGRCAARPLNKFFNVGQKPGPAAHDLDFENALVMEKMDGFLCILWFDPRADAWRVHTRGSFTSPHAGAASRMLDAYNLNALDKEYTYCLEGIHPDFPIRVDYGEEEKLVLLAARHTATGDAVPFKALRPVAAQAGIEMCPVRTDLTSAPQILAAMAEREDAVQEGWVVNAAGVLVKFKKQQWMEAPSLALTDIHSVLLECITDDCRIDAEKAASVKSKYTAKRVSVMDSLLAEYQACIDAEIAKIQSVLDAALEKIGPDVDQKKLAEALGITGARKSSASVNRHAMNLHKKNYTHMRTLVVNAIKEKIASSAPPSS